MSKWISRFFGVKESATTWDIKTYRFKCSECGCTYIIDGLPPLICYHCKEKKKHV